MARHGVSGGVARALMVCALGVSVASCGDTPTCQLSIVAPVDGMLLGPKDDVSNAIPGLQVSVTVAASGLSDGTPVQLSANGGAPSVGTVAGGQVVFSAFTITPDQQGRCALVAAAQSGCASPPVVVIIPAVTLRIAIVDPPDTFGFGSAQNHNPDPNDATFLYDVAVATSAASGTVALAVNGHAQPPVPVSGGQAIFLATVLPPGPVKLSASVSDRLGNTSVSTVSGTVTTHPPACDVIGFSPGVAVVKGFATPVLNVSVDEDPKAPGEQTQVVGISSSGSLVTLLLDGAARLTRVAGAMGDLAFDQQTLPEGAHVVQVRCVDSLGAKVSSPKLAVFVDSIAPLCALTMPSPHRVFMSQDDVDPMKMGVQVKVALTSPSPDAEGQAVSFGVNGVDQGAPEVAITSGAAAHEVTLTSPGTDTDEVTGSVSDAAANQCVATVEVGLDASGCALRFLRPAQVAPPKHPLILVQDDTSPPIDDGLQYDVALAVDQACLGKQVRLTVGGRLIVPDAPVVLDGGQKLGARADFPSAMVCPPGVNGAPPACDGIYSFFAAVTDNGGSTTGASLDVLVSAVPPTVALAPTPPAQGMMLPTLHCGDALTAAYDVDPMLPGVQLVMAATTSGKLLEVHVRGAAGELVYLPQAPDSSFSTVTLPEGFDELSAVAVAPNGNQGFSSVCELTVQGLTVLIAQPLDGALVAASGAQVSGAVSVAGAAIALFLDGAPIATGKANGNSWSFAKVMIPAGANRRLRVDAAGGGHAGSASATVTSDGVPPTTVTDLAATASARNQATLSFTAPSDDHPPLASYDLRTANAPITAPSFPQALSVAAAAPAAPGAAQTVVVDKLYPGVPAWFAIASLDRAGNRSAISNVVAATPTFIRQLIAPPVDAGELSGRRGFGQAAVGGDFDGDGFADAAVGAPLASYSDVTSGEGAVYVWFGGPGGFLAAPDLVLRGARPGAHAGAALAAGDWNGDGKADLAVAAPDLAVNDKNAMPVAVGGVYLILSGGAGLKRSMAPRALPVAADALVSGDPDDATMVNGRLGAALALPRFDADGFADLAIGAPGAVGGAGVALVVAGAPMIAPSLRLPKDVLSLAVRGWRLGCAGFPLAAGYGDRVVDVGRLEGPGDLTSEIAVASTSGERVAIFSSPMSGVDVDGATRALALLRDSGAVSLGQASAGVPDADSNQWNELLLGEPLALGGAGRILRLDGKRLPGGGALLDVQGQASFTLAGGAGDGLGSSLANLTELDGDAQPDLVFAAGGHGGQLHTAYGPNPYGQSAPVALFSPAAGAAAARTVVLVGDIDKDGLSDLLLLDPTQNGNAGRVELYH